MLVIFDLERLNFGSLSFLMADLIFVPYVLFLYFLFFTTGVLYRDAGSISLAIEAYEQCLKIDPDSRNAGQVLFRSICVFSVLVISKSLMHILYCTVAFVLLFFTLLFFVLRFIVALLFSFCYEVLRRTRQPSQPIFKFKVSEVF